MRYAAILYPGPAIAYAEGLEAVTVYPGLDQSLESRVREFLGKAMDSMEVPHK